MAWAYVISSSDRESFKRCRRAWDLGSRVRQNYEPVKPMRVFSFDRAIHDALAVYYFPGMWEWNRAIVLPLVLEGFLKSMTKQRNKYANEQELSSEENESWNEHLKLGENILKQYFAWAPTVDRFAPIQVETEFEVNIPDPQRPGQDLTVTESVPILPIRYRGRIDLLVVDQHNGYWLLDHRLAVQRWEDTDHLSLDELGVSYCWALENFYPGMKIAGTIYNELYIDTRHGHGTTAKVNLATRDDEETKHEKSPTVQNRRIYLQAIREPDPFINQQGNEFFRRTQIPRKRNEIENFGTQIVQEAMDIVNPGTWLYPNPSVENCSSCVFRRPCIAMNQGSDAGSILEISYRKRDEEQVEEGRLGGSTWSIDRGAMPPGWRRKQ